MCRTAWSEGDTGMGGNWDNRVYMLSIVCVVVFFFQAEDGIRDAQESRGLGDV